MESRGAPTAKGDLATDETSGGAVSGPGGTTVIPEALGAKGEIMVCLDLVLGVLKRAMGTEESEHGKGEEKRPLVGTEKTSG